MNISWVISAIYTERDSYTKNVTSSLKLINSSQ